MYHTNVMRRYVLGSAQSEDMFIIGMGFWAKYFIRTALLVIIHIICTQKWARGFKEPSRYDAYINIYNNKKEPASTGSNICSIICEDILMRCAANSIFDCAGVLKCTPSNQIIDVCKQVAK